MSVDIGTGEKALLETLLGLILLLLSGEIVRIEEFVDYLLILTDAVTEHPAVIAVVVQTPHYLDLLARFVGLDRLRTPCAARLVVVDADARVVAARSAAVYGGFVKCWPRCYGLENGAFGAGVVTGLVFG